MLTQARLKQLLHYDQKTGVFTWIVAASNRVRVGDIAGSLHRGYREIKVDHRMYPASNLAWLYVTGSLPLYPAVEIDHKNGVKDFNAFDNLREVTHTVNMQNQRGPTSQTSSGLLGVSRRQNVSGDVFHARIMVSQRLIHLGTFQSADGAHAAYLEAKRRLHPGNTL